MRVAALGRTRMLLDTIRLLVDSGHVVPLIVTCKASAKHTAQIADFQAIADGIGAKLLTVGDVNDPRVVGDLRAIAADVAVSVDWPKLIRDDACIAFPHGIFNAHGGDLPRYRGNAPVAWAMLMGESTIGLTIHKMDSADFDAGPIAVKAYYPISSQTYIREVFDFIESSVPKLFLDVIDKLSAGTLVLVPQSDHRADVLRCFPRLPVDAELDWRLPADHLMKVVHVNAEPFEGAFTYCQGTLLRVWRARATAWPVPSLAMPGHVVRYGARDGEIDVATGDGLLTLEEVELVNGGRCPPAMVVRGPRARLGVTAIDWGLRK